MYVSVVQLLVILLLLFLLLLKETGVLIIYN